MNPAKDRSSKQWANCARASKAFQTGIIFPDLLVLITCSVGNTTIDSEMLITCTRGPEGFENPAQQGLAFRTCKKSNGLCG